MVFCFWHSTIMIHELSFVEQLFDNYLSHSGITKWNLFFHILLDTCVCVCVTNQTKSLNSSMFFPPIPGSRKYIWPRIAELMMAFLNNDMCLCGGQWQKVSIFYFYFFLFCTPKMNPHQIEKWILTRNT